MPQCANIKMIWVPRKGLEDFLLVQKDDGFIRAYIYPKIVGEEARYGYVVEGKDENGKWLNYPLVDGVSRERAVAIAEQHTE